MVADAILPDQPTPHFWTWVPQIEKPEVVTSPFWPLLGFGLATLGLTGWVWRRYQHAVRLPQGLSTPAPGPDWLPLLPPESTGPELLSAEEVRNAVWSVGRFISEEYTPKLDLPRTVAATVRAGGIPILKHQRALYDREVWLWIDEQAEQPALLRLVRELQRSLQRAGLAVIGADPDGDIAARRLAIRLLDRGGVDTVLLGTDWPRHLDTLTGGARIATAQDQLLVILPRDATPPPALVDFPGEVAAVRAGDFEKLARALDYPGARKMSEVWGGESELRLWGGPEVDEEVGGMELVTVCGGTFSMGLSDDEKGASSNEHPRHPVTLDTFAIGKFEVTFAEYNQFAEATGRRNPVDEGWGRGNRPVINVKWDEARAFCQHYKLDKLDLPTEAQWEYAARAGTITAYWWGDDIGRNRANCHGCGSQWDNKETAPVGSFDPNPSGLHDTAGNVWEWTRDCYQGDLYKNRKIDQTTIDPIEDSMACRFRSLRGGSFDGSAVDLRSANRNRNRPDNRNRNNGFRCVRAPRRQHAVLERRAEPAGVL
jgi:formylglycine-generating enzyme required for sulfatase activity